VLSAACVVARLLSKSLGRFSSETEKIKVNIKAYPETESEKDMTKPEN